MNSTSEISALAFYAKHPVIMDALYEADDLEVSFEEYAREEGLPAELRTFVAENASLLTLVLAQVMQELRPFESMLLRTLSSRFRSKFTQIEKAQHDWAGKIWLSPKYSRPTRVQLELGWFWNTSDHNYWIVPWIWMRGGRRAERIVTEAFRARAGRATNVKPARELDEGNWVSGTVQLDRVNVTSRATADFKLDMKSLQDDVLRSFEWLHEDLAIELVKQARKSAR